ncbi:MAG TPA: pyridoxal-phosphate dependent enzyme [Sandaracinaceae bacterium LLY-WYZ-13_1]|nr:pyridoxal-phosphate dependent enzyme [Sandaracinaceae bacterium LLY-WYZ-13_1]
MEVPPPHLSEPLERPLFAAWPALRERVPWVALGELPTPVERAERLERRLGARRALWIKRDDRSSPVYGGNKVRTLEVLFGRARAHGATRIHATGAFGSNHAAATVLHAPAAGLEPGVILFPQPRSFAALENLRVVLAQRPRVLALPHWSALPFGVAWVRARERAEGVRSEIMVPGGATPEGALGYVSAGLELARQVADGELPTPGEVVIGVGSTCTSAGLLVGLRAAAELGLGWRAAPTLRSVRVTPWPVTSRARIVGLARRTAALLAELVGEPRWAFDRAALSDGLALDGAQLGRGYGHPTPDGLDALRLTREAAHLALDTTYSAKAMASVLERLRTTDGPPLVYWSTKSTAPLPEVAAPDWRWGPRMMTRWIEKAEAACAPP